MEILDSSEMSELVESTAGNSRAFRKDIAGLRGIAVLAVVFAHFKIPGFSSGFIGVDIFFVISGFLITGLMAREYEVNSELANGWGWISLPNFYLRRIRRIFPAAFTVIVCTLLFSILQLNSVRVSQVKSDAVWAILSFANINFMHQSTNYFFDGLAVSPLLHYWSLGVEEQFYMLWPLLFLAAVSFHGLQIKRRKYSWRDRVRRLSLVITIVSFLVMIIGFTINPNSAYFSPLTRAWELGVGAYFGLLSFPDKPEANHVRTVKSFRVTALIGLGLSFFLVTDSNFGVTLILPVFSSGYLIWSYQSLLKADIPAKIFSNALLLKVGNISFSLYLWHWPVSILGTELGWINNLGDRLFAIAVSLFLAVVTYSQVEQRFQRIPVTAGESKKVDRAYSPFPISRVRIVIAASICAVSLTLFTYPQILTSNFSFNISKKPDPWSAPVPSDNETSEVQPNVETGANPSKIFEIPTDWKVKLSRAVNLASIPSGMRPSLGELLNDRSPIWNECLAGGEVALPLCTFGSKSESAKTAIVLGDSFAISFYGAILGALPESDWKIQFLTRAECMVADVTPIVNSRPDSDCVAHRKWTQEYVKTTHPDLLILQSSSSHDIDGSFEDFSIGFDSAIKVLTENSKKVVTIGLAPGSGNLTTCATKSLEILSCYPSIRAGSSYRYEEERVSKKYGAFYIDPTPWLCFLGRCPPIIDDTPAYFDGGHLSATMSRKLAPLLKGALASVGVK